MRAVPILSFQVSLLLQSSAAQHFLESFAKHKAPCPFSYIQLSQGRVLAQFPKFVLEDKHHSIQIFNVGATDKAFWEVKSWSCGDISVIHILYLMATCYSDQELSCG